MAADAVRWASSSSAASRSWTPSNRCPYRRNVVRISAWPWPAAGRLSLLCLDPGCCRQHCKAVVHHLVDDLINIDIKPFEQCLVGDLSLKANAALRVDGPVSLARFRWLGA